MSFLSNWAMEICQFSSACCHFTQKTEANFMNIHNLQYFCSVAKHLNFSKAAEECHIAQTAMSRSIAAMEEELGFRLFERTRHHVELTTAGAYFLKEATRIVEQYHFSLQSGLEISRSSSSRLDIGFGGYDMNFARFYVGRFMQLHPECTIVLREYHYDTIFRSLLSRTCDVIFTAQTRIEDETAVKQVMVSRSRHVIGVGLRHPLSRYDVLTPDQLDGMQFICPVDINASWEQAKILSKLFSHYGIKPGPIIRTNSAIAVTTMLDLGMGVTFLTEDIVLANKNIKMIPLLFDQPVTKCHVAAQLIPSKRPLIDQFMDFVENTPFQKD